MPRPVTYRIIDQPDGRFAVLAAMGAKRTYRRADFATLAEAEAWIDGLRILMAACGAPVVGEAPDAEPADMGPGVSLPASSTLSRDGAEHE